MSETERPSHSGVFAFIVGGLLLLTVFSATAFQNAGFHRTVNEQTRVFKELSAQHDSLICILRMLPEERTKKTVNDCLDDPPHFVPPRRGVTPSTPPSGHSNPGPGGHSTPPPGSSPPPHTTPPSHTSPPPPSPSPTVVCLPVIGCV